MRLRNLCPLILALTLSALLSSGCSTFRSEPYVKIASDPPGARILIDSRDSGFVTPAVMHLDVDDDHRVDLQLPGYAPATRFLGEWGISYVLLWEEMIANFETWRFPVWLGFRDFFTPYKKRTISAPNRIFVRLQRQADR